jgi:hypothetical protein
VRRRGRLVVVIVQVLAGLLLLSTSIGDYKQTRSPLFRPTVAFTVSYAPCAAATLRGQTCVTVPPLSIAPEPGPTSQSPP